MSFDVSMRLNLEYKDQDARRAEKDLKDLSKAADRLNGTSAGKLERNLEEVSRNARQAATALELPADKVARLNALKTDQVEGELKALKTTAKQVGGSLELPAKQIRELNRIKTDPVEAELKALGKAATTTANNLDKINNQKFNRLNGEIDKSRAKLSTLNDRLSAHSAINAPAGRLTGVMSGLGTAAGSAFTGLMAFASVDNILRGLNQLESGFNKLDDAAARVAVTAEMLSPEAVEEIKASNEALALQRGHSAADVNAARNVLAAANFPIDKQNQVLGPTIDAAHASDADPETIARAVLSGINSLGLSEADIPAFLDQIVKGGKEGEFEIEAMAKYFPELGAIYAASGRTGLDASAELIALAQITRKGAGMESSAATNLQNFLSKISAKDAVKNFEEKGIDLKKLSMQATATGTPYVLSLLSEIEKLGGDDEFVLNELYPDMQVKAAIRPLLANKELYSKIFDAVRNQSAGVVQKDADFISARPHAEARRREVAWGQVGADLGSAWGNAIGGLRDEVLGWLNPDWRRAEESRKERLRLRETNIEGLKADIVDIQSRISDMPKPQGDFPDVNVMGRTNLELRLKALQDELRKAQEAQGKDSQLLPGPEMHTMDPSWVADHRSDLTKTPEEAAGFHHAKPDAMRDRALIPRPKPEGQGLPGGTGAVNPQSFNVPLEDLIEVLPTDVPNMINKQEIGLEPDLGKVSGKLAPAGAEAGAKFAAALKSEAERVGAVADELKARFSFTATPTISPSYSAVPSSASAPAPASTRRSSAQTSRPVVNQKIYGKNDPRRTARAVIREENRAVRRTMARALHDRGPLA